jgi:hypothetical protein
LANRNPASKVIDRIVADLKRADVKASKTKIPNMGEEPPTSSDRARAGIEPLATRHNIHRDAFTRLDRRLRGKNGRP